MKISFFLFSICIIILTSCENYSQDDYQEYYVVESYLVADRQLPNLRLSTTSSINQSYSFEDVAVGGADVSIRLLQNDGITIDRMFPYSSDSTGIYYSLEHHKVLPRRTYQLHVSLNNGADIITASTIIPETFEVLSEVLDTLVYQSTEQLEITISETSSFDDQSVFIFNTLAQQPLPENLTPVYFDFYSQEDGSEAKELLTEFSKTSSGLLNEANFSVDTDGSVTIRYPWIAVAFYGDNKLVASTVDDNIYDFIRSSSVQLGGSTLSPGEIQNVITRINGGIGIFGSMASDTIKTFIKPNFEF
jgi:hypothetical protein